MTRHLGGRDAQAGLAVHACQDIQRDAVTADAEDKRDCYDELSLCLSACHDWSWPNQFCTTTITSGAVHLHCCDHELNGT